MDVPPFYLLNTLNFAPFVLNTLSCIYIINVVIKTN